MADILFPDKRLLSVREASTYVHMGATTLRAWGLRNQLVRKMGGRTFYDRPAIDRVLGNGPVPLYPNKTLLNTNEAINYTGLGIVTLIKWAKANEVLQKIGRRRFFNRVLIDQLIDKVPADGAGEA